MSPVYLLLRGDAYARKESIEKLLQKLFKEKVEIRETPSGFYEITLAEGLLSQVVLQASYEAATQDFQGSLKAVIVPSLEGIFQKALPYAPNDKIVYLFEICREHPDLYLEGQTLLEKIDEETLLTVKTYIETERSPSLSALRLYVHRNTVSYRIERFEEKSGIALENWGNEMYVYELIKAYEKLHGGFAR